MSLNKWISHLCISYNGLCDLFYTCILFCTFTAQNNYNRICNANIEKLKVLLLLCAIKINTSIVLYTHETKLFTRLVLIQDVINDKFKNVCSMYFCAWKQFY